MQILGAGGDPGRRRRVGSGEPELQGEEEKGEPNEVLNYRRLDDEVGAQVAVHGLEQRHADNEGVGQRRQREGRHRPGEAAVLGEVGPGDEGGDDEGFGDGVGGEEEVVEVVRVDVRHELEVEEGDDEEAVEAVNGVALVGFKHVPPPDREVAQR